MPGSVHKALAAASKSCKTYRLPEGSARVEPQYGTWCPQGLQLTRWCSVRSGCEHERPAYRDRRAGAGLI